MAALKYYRCLTLFRLFPCADLNMKLHFATTLSTLHGDRCVPPPRRWRASRSTHVDRFIYTLLFSRTFFPQCVGVERGNAYQRIKDVKQHRYFSIQHRDWLQMEFAPETYSRDQLDELDRLTEKLGQRRNSTEIQHRYWPLGAEPFLERPKRADRYHAGLQVVLGRSEVGDQAGQVGEGSELCHKHRQSATGGVADRPGCRLETVLDAMWLHRPGPSGRLLPGPPYSAAGSAQ